jgi:glycosyltransferase involved in cell wall biosynthesis
MDLLEHDGRRQAIAQNGLQSVRKIYSWRVIGRKLNEVYYEEVTALT